MRYPTSFDFGLGLSLTMDACMFCVTFIKERKSTALLFCSLKSYQYHKVCMFILLFGDSKHDSRADQYVNLFVTS
jgi:hypothetical protein